MSETSTTDEPDDDLALFREFASSRRRTLRNELVERHMGLAVHIANRYRRSNVNDDDLRQVAMIGLVKAVDRFDPDYGASFSAFAGRTIEGELKRHFRDRSWVVRVPRSAKELHLLVRRASDDLAHELSRSPTVDEIAEHLQVDRDDVLRGLAASAAYNVGTIDVGVGDEGNDTSTDRQRVLATDDLGFENTENRQVVLELLDRLPEREREIVRLRFYERMSQSEIGEAVGVSQMHVSRLLRRSFEQMREWIDDPSAVQDSPSESAALE
ncbi:MAG TPA: SigB/SigF/SigG family RNA polymerase sigma factor [Ilumatobacteraceae bacterium]|nr:SigB/SigF/SigG family RNA polymerase sigma factor [Ilumatobacteraceae bacterium]